MSNAQGATVAVGWYRLSMPQSDGDTFAQVLLDRANDSSRWSLANFGAMAMRRRMPDREEFLFSPHAVPAFRDLIDAHGGGACDPPRARELVPSKTSRMLLGFRTRWESFAPARILAQGVPRA
jgi:hypothetical protein